MQQQQPPFPPPPSKKTHATVKLDHRGLAEFLGEDGKPNAGNFTQYKLVAHEVTKSFQGLSADILTLQDECVALGRDDLVSASSVEPRCMQYVCNFGRTACFARAWSVETLWRHFAHTRRSGEMPKTTARAGRYTAAHVSLQEEGCKQFSSFLFQRTVSIMLGLLSHRLMFCASNMLRHRI